MLTYATYKFVGNIQDIISNVCEYRSRMIELGFYCRKSCVVFHDERNRHTYLNGILGHNQALEDAHSHPMLRSLLAKITKDNITSDTVQYFDCCSDYDYCKHNRWESLALVCNHIIGAPSLVCSLCGGLVANYRIDMSAEAKSKLWLWERQHDAIDDLSSTCDEYESWADSQLCAPNSPLNCLGVSVAQIMAKELGFPVFIILRMRNMDYNNCPICKHPLSTDVAHSDLPCCEKCHIQIWQQEE